MNNISAKTVSIIGIVTAALVGGSVSADDNPAYWVNPDGKVWMSGFGECWRSSDWTPGTAIEQCDPDQAKQRGPAPVQVATVVPEPEPEPVAAEITLGADALFDFNKSELRPEGERALDNFISQLGGVDYESVIVVGHTDRLGSMTYNYKLSERRAESVQNYLVAKGVPSQKINAKGRGESFPATAHMECQGLSRAAQIACYQPDRRVEIMVTGTRN